MPATRRSTARQLEIGSAMLYRKLNSYGIIGSKSKARKEAAMRS
jgi:DNA-binding NtrC family response regulator